MTNSVEVGASAIHGLGVFAIRAFVPGQTKHALDDELIAERLKKFAPKATAFEQPHSLAWTDLKKRGDPSLDRRVCTAGAVLSPS
ncbi:MAG: hypothetical protein J0I77_11480 [Rudaea sp.]|uniref:hypothetical protein n=1 Tax=unclassified Rudaea TaxID=2627037 RepID=UPI0010F9F36B|nr:MULTISPECIES: hypothetical protein [unclassified Rudaea]MBN8886332.1 hypothetical protein [Rudaea sp.]